MNIVALIIQTRQWSCRRKHRRCDSTRVGPLSSKSRGSFTAVRQIMPQTNGIVDIRAAATIDVDKSSYHQLSQFEIAGDNPCSQQLSGNLPVSGHRVCRDFLEPSTKSGPKGSSAIAPRLLPTLVILPMVSMRQHVTLKRLC
jgi:hypothetical protein